MNGEIIIAFRIYNKRRSIRSYLFEKYIILSSEMKDNLSSIEKAEKMVASAGKENIKPYLFPKVNLTSDVKEYSFEEMQVFILNNKESLKQKVIIYVHGGAHLYQPISFHWKFMDKMAQSLNAKVVAPIYPKIPNYNYQHTYPGLLSLYKKILESVDSPQQLTIMGDSAGGNISLSLAQYLKTNQLPHPKDIILLSPCVDMVLDNPVIFDYVRRDPMLAAEGYDVIRRIWAADKSLEDPLISPIYGELEGLGKITIFIGTYEGLFPDNMRLDKKLTDRGIEHNTFVYPKMNHVFVIMPIPEAKDAQQKIINIINE